jgi:outer membrane protein OmpA-like peptidoglycan-associated protein
MMKKTVPLVLLSLFLAFCSQEKKLLRKASSSVDNSEFDKAIGYYDQVIEKNDKSFFGYAGKGIVLSEYMGRHEQAIPFLEKALANSPPEKTKPIIHGNLAQSYQFIGNYKRALQYYGKLESDPTYAEYDRFLSKRIADCKYAIEHPEIALAENQAVNNIGAPVNTDKPEYTPVVVNNTMYFTSKRQDDPKEKKNGIDGRYFESVYASTVKDGAFSEPVKVNLTLENGGIKLRKSGEAVVSASPDGKSLYIYKEGKIYSTPAEGSDHKLTMVDKTINFADLQNHAALSPDGKTMFFTSEAPNGRGGSDIYYSTLGDDGKWTNPRALDNTVNTPYDEDAPFMNESGVLFFASNGHPGYGGFDVYRTQLVNGAWTPPVNLGQPINSPGDDIFFTLMPNSSKGYYASARPGGRGDLDIYKIHYVITDAPPCKPEDLLTIVATPDPNNPMAYNMSLNVPEQYRDNIKQYTWEVNGKPVAASKQTFTYNFDKPDSYKISARAVAWCDTCPRLIGMCRDQTIEVKNNMIASAETDKNATAANEKGTKGKSKSTTKGKNKNATDVASSGSSAGKGGFPGGSADADNNKTGGTTAAESDVASANTKRTSTGTNQGKSGAGSGSTDFSANIMTEEELKSINWNTSPSKFDLNAYEVKEDAKAILNQDLEVLKSKDNLQVVIHGHADSRGDAAYNKRLSMKRAEAVKEYFVSQGIAGKRIKTKGHGEEQLVNNCADGVECDESQHAQNRRVNIDVINPNKGAITQR